MIISIAKSIYRNLLSEKVRRRLTPKLRSILNSCRNLLESSPVESSPVAFGIGEVPELLPFHNSYLKKSFAQQGEDLVLDRILTRILDINLTQPGTYVDVGAFHPIEHSVTYLLYLRGWKGVAIDASKETEKEFKRRRPKDHFFQCVVGFEDEVDVSFYLRNGIVNDLSLINTKYPDNESYYQKVVLRQRNLNVILRGAGISEIVVLNLDIEGAEEEVLNDFDFDQFKPKVIAVEIHGNDVKKCIESPVAQLLINKGYTCVASCVITFFFIKRW